MGRSLSPPQIHQKNISMLSKFHNTTSECPQRTSGTQKSSSLSSKTGRKKYKRQKKRQKRQAGSSIPTSFVSLFFFYIFSYLVLKTMGCFSGCLMSSAGIQKLFYVTYSPLKCSFDEFVGEKVVSPSYSSFILGVPPRFHI